MREHVERPMAWLVMARSLENLGHVLHSILFWSGYGSMG